MDPGPSLRRTHQAILANEWPVDAEPTAAAASPAARRPRQLPPDVRGFTGRAKDLGQLDALLSDRDIGAVVITAIAGIAGVGKPHPEN